MQAKWSALFLGIAVAGASALGTGCSSEEYYCDESACYYCDGVGCRAVDPPDRPDCVSDDQCGTAQECTSLGCTSKCTADSDCPEGTVCRDAYCVSPSENDPEELPLCTQNSDCGEGAEFICVDGACQSNPIDDIDTCQFNTECGENRVCVNEYCAAACRTATDCPEGQTCDDEGFCRAAEDVIPMSCTDGLTDCGGGVCVNGACEDRCSTDDECGSGRYCASGVCVVDTRPDPVCDTDAQCMPGHPCINGACRTPCSTNTECLEFDVQFNFCIDNFCRTTSEATSNCNGADDCESGDICLDGVCQ